MPPQECLFLELERIDYYSVVLRSKLLGLLAERYRIVVLTTDIDAEASIAFGYLQHPNVIYEKIPVRYPRLWKAADRMRRYFVRTYDHFFTTQEGFYFYPRNRWERFWIWAGHFAPKSIITPWFFSAIESFLARPSPEFKELARTFKPVLMMVAPPGYRNLALTAEALYFSRGLGIPTISLYSSFDNPYSMPKFFRPTDYICVWSDRMKREVIDVHRFRPEDVFVVGCLKFDHYFRDIEAKRIRSREAFLRAKNLDPSKKLVVYATTVPGFKQNDKLMTFFARIKKEKLFHGDPNILVRIHPHDYWDTYVPFHGIPGISIERAGTVRLPDTAFGPKVEMTEADLVNQTETFYYCDVLVNQSSTTLLEASLFDTPVASIGWPKRLSLVYQIEITKAFKNSGAERNAEDPETLIRYVNEYLDDPKRDSKNRKAIVAEFVQFTDGRSYERTADAIREVLRRAK